MFGEAWRKLATFSAVAVLATVGSMLQGEYSARAQASCDLVERQYHRCVEAGQRAYQSAPVGQGDFSYISRCEAERRRGLEGCAGANQWTANRVIITREPPPPETAPRDCMTAEQMLEITPQQWMAGSFLPPCDGEYQRYMQMRRRGGEGTAPPPSGLASCSDVTRWVRREARHVTGPGACDNEVALYLTNTAGVRALCQYQFEHLDGQWSGGMTGVPDRTRVWTCDGTGRVRLVCRTQPDSRRDFECRF